MNTKVKGALGEAIAEKFLKKKGYKILFKNYTNAVGEIDIVAKFKDYIVFVEVKYKETAEMMLPREMVDVRKQNKLRGVASMFLQEKRMSDVLCRFDVVEVLGDKITHIENAF